MAPPALPAEADAALRRFRLFYEELFTIKRLLRDGDWAALLGNRPAAASMPEQLLLAVRQRLRSAIAAQGFGGTIARGAPAGVDPGYIFSALADATLLHDLAWPGREGWADAPLEVVLYRSRIAGDRLFEAVDELVRRRDNDPDGVAMTLLLALEVGYRGRYRGNDDHGEIQRVKARLFQLVFQGPPALPMDFDGLTVGAAEALTAQGSTRLPDVRPWARAMVCVAIGYILLSGLIWWNEVGDIVGAAARAAASLNQPG